MRISHLIDRDSVYISTYAFFVYSFSVRHVVHVEPSNIYEYYFLK
jgi:hypothetical protein